MERTFWDKLRILVTNKCNNECPFCHNEGQLKAEALNMISFDDFKTLIDILNGQIISELHFSGGEPFLNKDIVKMIEYVDKKTNWGIGCATNLSIITSEQVASLAKTRVKFNIQFPYANERLFKLSTGNGDFYHICNQIKMIKQAGIRLGLNAVVQNNNKEHIRELLLFAIENEVALKLLPQIGLDESVLFKNELYPVLKEYATDCYDKKTGALRWTVEKDGRYSTVLYIDSPCFDKDINKCREFGEIRIHPDISLQPCIFKDKLYPMNLNLGKEEVLSKMQTLWNNFNNC